jgi:hypothetical protein
MSIEGFDENKRPDIKVKDIISFLKQFDPETSVLLDKDGWQTYDEVDMSKDDIIRYLIDDSAIIRGQNYLMINN